MQAQRDNPFHYNYIFTKKDLCRQITGKWFWKYPFLIFHPMLVQINEGIVFKYKQIGNQYYLMGHEALPKINTALCMEMLQHNTDDSVEIDC